MFENFITNYQGEGGELVEITVENRQEVMVAFIYATKHLEEIFKEHQSIKIKDKKA